MKELAVTNCLRFMVLFSVVCVSETGSQSYAVTASEKPMNLAFVLLREAQLPKGEEIVRAFPAFAMKGQTLHFKGNQLKEETQLGVLEFELQPGGSAFIALMPTAVPNGEAENAVRFSVSAFGTGWKLPTHKAHLVVSLRHSDSASLSDTLSLFTSLLGAVSKTSNAVGVYWGDAGATHDAKFLMSIAQERDPDSRIMLWTGVSVGREADGRLSLLSLGMNQLNLPDLLLIAQKSDGNEALGTFFDFLGYVRKLGKPLPEGDTIGRTADERLPIRYEPSPIDPSKKVWRVEIK
jgi:hypothetical protein